MVEVAHIRPENDIRIRVDGASVQLLKAGLYEFDADHQQVRVFEGKAAVQRDDRQVDVKSGRQLAFDVAGTKAQKFDKKTYEDDFYHWASLRSAYLAEANVDVARTYAGGGGWLPSMWYGAGWYWDPWFGAYTFIPADGIFFGPFGWGYYSPWMVYSAPYYGFGFGGYYHRFGPGYHPPYVVRGPRAQRVAGPAFVPRAGGFSRVGGSGNPRPAAHVGGVGGGGFHGGGRGGGRR